MATGNDLGRRIREARERAQLTQAEFGQLVSLDRTVVNKIESGTRKVTAIELSDVARALGLRMSSFFTTPAPGVVSHRNNRDHESAEPLIDRELARLADDVQFVQSLAAEGALGGQPPATPLPDPSTPADAEQLAGQARGLLGLEDDEPVGDLVAMAANIGLLAFSMDLGPDTADAGTTLLARGGLCLINSHHKVGRRRLGLAHEIGHFLLADEYTVDWRVTGSRDGVEARLDRFARALLLPATGLQAVWGKEHARHTTHDAAVITASRFRVDMSTLATRLTETATADRSTADAVRATATTRADIVEHGLLVTYDLEGTSLPMVYQRAVLRLCRDERISEERALELLLDTFDASDLPAPRERREDEIWRYVS